MEPEKINEPVVTKKAFKDLITESTNWLTGGFAVVMYVGMGVMNYENGNLTLKDFSNYTWLDWVLWIIMTFVPAVLAVVFSNAFEKEGIKVGEEKISLERSSYEKLLYVEPTKVLRSKAEYLKDQRTKKLTKKFMIALVISFFSGQLFLGFSYDKLFKIIINLGMWLYFGFQAYGEGNSYAVQELKEWYMIETGRLTNIKKKLAEEEADRVAKKLAEEEADRVAKKLAEEADKVAKLKDPIIKPDSKIHSPSHLQPEEVKYELSTTILKPSR